MIKKDTLVIIGNGFDRWQNLKTGYKDFEKYYYTHKDDILKKLKINKKVIEEYNGEKHEISDLELIYGNPFEAGNLDSDFWSDFENSMDKINAAEINLFFGKDKKELKHMSKSIKNAKNILREAFCSWISEIQINNKQEFTFSKNCYFVNFNYTKTLEKYFGVDEEDIFYIHGETNDKESIIFGHSSHPQEPEETLYQIGGRFRGLYLIEKLLYNTDKHVMDNITDLCLDLKSADINPDDIKDIYILGHSLGEVDLEYFKFFKKALSVSSTNTEESFNNFDFNTDLFLRLQYIIKKYGQDNSITDPILPEEETAIHKKLMYEQFQRDMQKHYEYETLMLQLTENYIKIKPKEILKTVTNNLTQKNSGQRIKNAKWHISCYTDKDVERAKEVMKMLEVEDYEVLNNIEDAVKILKKQHGH